MDIFQGSSWWCVTWNCLNEIRNGFEDNKISSFFKTCFAPDEMMIQTIVFNSSFAKHAIIFEGEYPGLPKLTPLHYIEYGEEIKTYQEADFEKLIKSGKMFFRKARTGISDSLLDRIDIYRQN